MLWLVAVLLAVLIGLDGVRLAVHGDWSRAVSRLVGVACLAVLAMLGYRRNFASKRAHEPAQSASEAPSSGRAGLSGFMVGYTSRQKATVVLVLLGGVAWLAVQQDWSGVVMAPLLGAVTYAWTTRRRNRALRERS
jgi:hypothetical protein